MKKVLVFIFALLILLAEAQNDTKSIKAKIDTLVLTEQHVEAAFDAIKKYRNRTNQYTDLDTNHELLQEERLKTLYNSIKNIDNSTTTTFDLGNLDGVLFKNHFGGKTEIKDATLEDVMYVARQIDSSLYIHEPLSINISFAAINEIGNPEIDLLIEDYNAALGSAGRRMGRLVQMSIEEDQDYVTPTSLTRLNLAMTDFKLAQSNLRSELFRQLQQSHFESDTGRYRPQLNRIEEKLNKNTKETSKQYMFLETNLVESVGLGWCGMFPISNRELTFDGGLSLLFGFKPEGDIIFHPKVGLGKEHFHFLLGAWISAVEQSASLTGNVIYTNQKFSGGIGFNTDQIIFSIGFRVFNEPKSKAP